MPGRFTITADEEILEKRFNAKVPKDYDPRYNVSPSQLVPIILNTTPHQMVMARWGFKSDYFTHLLINARSEDIEHNRVFGKAFRERRCLISADSYYEWESTKKGKMPYRIMLKDESIFSIAGVYQETKDGIEFAAITIAPNKFIGKVHERMPVILHKEDEEKWLKEPDITLLKSYPAKEMMMYHVNSDVNSSKHDLKYFIKPVGEKIFG